MAGPEFPQLFGVGGLENNTVGPVLASAATIAPTYGVHHVSGTAAVSTITPPWPGFTGTICLIPDGAFSITAGALIKNNIQAVVNVPIFVEFDNAGNIYCSANYGGGLTYVSPLAFAPPGASIAGSVIGIGTLDLAPLPLPAGAVFASAYVGRSNTYSATNAASSWGVSDTVSLGIWTKNGASLSLASSGSISTAYTVTGSSSSVSYQGLKLQPVPITVNATPGNYWYGYIYSSASAGNAIAGAQSNAVLSVAGALSGALGVYGSSSAASFSPVLGMGALSVSTASLPAAIAFSDLVTAGNTGVPLVNFVNFTV